ncbi:hypothetical protein [Planctomicrobium sp. SH527]|uniref:hypothetical protein n=1 Tax=Planctomicrobium sp. SH527 TaxID=3448123 RepID=UPI003F5BE1BA
MNATALLRQQGRILSIVATDEYGVATFSGLTSGIYEITVGNRSEFVRIWTDESAPAVARSPLTLTQDSRPIGASGPYAALALMSPGGSPAPFVLKSEDAIRTCRNCEIRLTPDR